MSMLTIEIIVPRRASRAHTARAASRVPPSGVTFRCVFDVWHY